jgi:hypothetical protein
MATKHQKMLMAWGLPMTVGVIREHLFVRAVRANEDQIIMGFGEWLVGQAGFEGIANRATPSELLRLYAEYLEEPFEDDTMFSARLQAENSTYKRDRSREVFRVFRARTSVEGVDIAFDWQGRESMIIAWSSSSREIEVNNHRMDPKDPFDAGALIEIAGHLYYAIGIDISHDEALAQMRQLIIGGVFPQGD